MVQTEYVEPSAAALEAAAKLLGYASWQDAERFLVGDENVEANPTVQAFARFERDTTASLASPINSALVDALAWLRRNAAGLKADVALAHRSRGNGYTEWMAEDDRDFRRDLAKHLAVLATPPEQDHSTSNGEGA